MYWCKCGMLWIWYYFDLNAFWEGQHSVQKYNNIFFFSGERAVSRFQWVDSKHYKLSWQAKNKNKSRHLRRTSVDLSHPERTCIRKKGWDVFILPPPPLLRPVHNSSTVTRTDESVPPARIIYIDHFDWFVGSCDRRRTDRWERSFRTLDWKLKLKIKLILIAKVVYVFTLHIHKYSYRVCVTVTVQTMYFTLNSSATANYEHIRYHCAYVHVRRFNSETTAIMWSLVRNDVEDW